MKRNNRVITMTYEYAYLCISMYIYVLILTHGYVGGLNITQLPKIKFISMNKVCLLTDKRNKMTMNRSE